MKKGGVAREIKGCRRRCLHHPAPTSAGKRGAKGERKRRKRKRERIAETRDTHNTPRYSRTTHHIAQERARDGMHATR